MRKVINYLNALKTKSSCHAMRFLLQNMFCKNIFIFSCILSHFILSIFRCSFKVFSGNKLNVTDMLTGCFNITAATHCLNGYLHGNFQHNFQTRAHKIMYSPPPQTSPITQHIHKWPPSYFVLGKKNKNVIKLPDKICYLGKFQRFWFNSCKVKPGPH